MQYAVLYWCSIIFKTGIEWSNGTAVYYALNLDVYSTFAGKLLLKFPILLRFLTRATLIMEYAIPATLMSPIFQPQLKIIGVLLIFGLHGGFRVLGLFNLFDLFVHLLIYCLDLHGTRAFSFRATSWCIDVSSFMVLGALLSILIQENRSLHIIL